MCVMLWELGRSFGVSYLQFQSEIFRISTVLLRWLGLLRACELLEPECLVQMLKAVKHLSMNATLLEVLQNANALEILIRILEEQSSGPHSTVRIIYIIVFLLNITPASGDIKPCLPNLLQPLSSQ